MAAGASGGARGVYNPVMPFLIDGHNLIPKIGLRLDSPDDELQLLTMLQEHSRRTRRPIEVYFDGAPPGRAGSRQAGKVKAHFVRQSSTADAAIQARLRALGRAARNWTVVSSDRAVQLAATASGASAMTSEQFARDFLRGRPQLPVDGGKPSAGKDGGLSDDEIDDWLSIFGKR